MQEWGGDSAESRWFWAQWVAWEVEDAAASKHFYGASSRQGLVKPTAAGGAACACVPAW